MYLCSGFIGNKLKNTIRAKLKCKMDWEGVVGKLMNLFFVVAVRKIYVII